MVCNKKKENAEETLRIFFNDSLRLAQDNLPNEYDLNEIVCLVDFSIGLRTMWTMKISKMSSLTASGENFIDSRF